VLINGAAHHLGVENNKSVKQKADAGNFPCVCSGILFTFYLSNPSCHPMMNIVFPAANFANEREGFKKLAQIRVIRGKKGGSFLNRFKVAT
jgi:hypothetical protein